MKYFGPWLLLAALRGSWSIEPFCLIPSSGFLQMLTSLSLTAGEYLELDLCGMSAALIRFVMSLTFLWLKVSGLWLSLETLRSSG